VANDAFCCSAIPEETEAKYENGLLSIKMKFKDTMENAVKVKIA
jgi:hypothetical protein